MKLIRLPRKVAIILILMELFLAFDYPFFMKLAVVNIFILFIQDEYHKRKSGTAAKSKATNYKSIKSYKAKKTIPDNIVVKYMVICGIIGAVITIIFFEHYWVGVGLGLGMIVGILVSAIINNK